MPSSSSSTAVVVDMAGHHTAHTPADHPTSSTMQAETLAHQAEKATRSSIPGEAEEERKEQTYQQSLVKRQVGVVVADRSARITHVNDDFCNITGYTAQDAVNKNCNFLQGESTSATTVKTIRDALNTKRPCRVAILNYRKDGQPFWNLLSIFPLLDAQGSVDQYVGIQMVQDLGYVDQSLGLLPWLQSPLPGSERRRSAELSRLAMEEDRDARSVAEWRKQQQQQEQQQKLQQTPVAAPVHAVAGEEAKLATPHAQADPVAFVAETNLPTRHGTYRVRTYSGAAGEIVCIIHGKVEGGKQVPVRVHDQCFTSEVLGSLKCDCREQLDWAMRYIRGVEAGGMVLYMQQEGRGIGLGNKIKAYSLQEHGYDTVEANVMLGFEEECRDYACVPSVLSELRVDSIQLITNNPYKIKQLEGLGVSVTGRIPIVLPSNEHSEHYLHTKASRMGHMLQ